MSRDPIEEKGGLNLYGMVRNNALRRMDWLGMLTKSGDIVGDEGRHGTWSLDYSFSCDSGFSINGIDGDFDGFQDDGGFSFLVVGISYSHKFDVRPTVTSFACPSGMTGTKMHVNIEVLWTIQMAFNISIGVGPVGVPITGNVLPNKRRVGSTSFSMDLNRCKCDKSAPSPVIVVPR